MSLRYLADAYEQSQRLRIETGERIRAVMQGRDQTWSTNGFAHQHPDLGEKCKKCDIILKQIAAGKTEGPVSLLGRTYRRHWEGEREAYKEMNGQLLSHPAWPWIQEVKGVGDTLACKLLARLDVCKADTPSAFWAYCGLSTVPAILYRCNSCGLERGMPASYKVKAEHLKLNSKRKCEGELKQIGEGRCAMPRPSKGEKATYDKYAKKVCYLIGTQFVKIPNSPFGQFYCHIKHRLVNERPGWQPGRIHLTALRKTEKLFLSMLWAVWRKAEGLPMRPSWIEEHGEGTHHILDPWEFVRS